VNCEKLSDNWNNSPKRGKIPASTCIIYDKGKRYPSLPGKKYPSTKKEFLSTRANAGRERILGIF
jgi:hypothetical protein